jgi:tape measure domain-containing protein
MAVERVVIEITGDTSKIKSTIAELEKLGKVDRDNADSFNRNNKKFNDNLNSTKGNLGSFGDQLNSLKQQVIGAFAISSLIAFGKEAVQTSAKIESIGNSLKFITGSSANAEKTMQYLTGLSERLGLEFESTAQAFKLFAGAATQSGMTLSQSKTIFEQVSKAVTTMGLSADDAEGVFLALSQIMSKGKVSAEELRGQIGERLPGAFAIAAKSIGVSEQALNKMLEQGQVLSKDFLPKFASQLEKDLGGGAEAAANSTQAALNRMKNSYGEFLLYLGQKLTPAVLALTKILQGYTYALRGAAGERERAAREQGTEYTKEIVKGLEKIEGLNARSDAALEKRNFFQKREFQTQQEINKLIAERDELLSRPRKAGTAISGRLNEIEKEIQALAGNKYMYQEITSSLKEYENELSQQNKSLFQNTEETNANTKSKEKQLGEYDKLVQSASMVEKALQDLYATGVLANTPLEIKLRTVLAQIDMINERVRQAKEGFDKMQVKTGSEKGGTPDAFTGAIKLASESGQFNADKSQILIKGEIGVVEKIIDGKKQLVYDYETWLTNYMLDQAKQRGKEVSDANAEFEKIEAERRKKFFDEKEEQRKQNELIAINASMEILSIGLDYAYTMRQKEYDSELMLLDNMLKSKKITEDEYNRRRKEIQNEEANAQKEYSIFKATIDTANAILNALATGGPAAPALAIAAGIVGAAQIAAIMATPLPQYAEGTEFVQLGKNKKGKDTIPALLNEGEAVIKTDKNAEYPGLAKAWNDGKLDEHIYKKWVLPEVIMNKSYDLQKQRSFADNVAKSIQLNQDFGGIETKLNRLDDTEKMVGGMIVTAIKESKKTNIW